MQEQLIPIIENIVKYGLYPYLEEEDAERSLEKNIIKLYSLYFEIEYTFDNTEYPEFSGAQYLDIREHVCTNFKDFGYYTPLYISDPGGEKTDNILGDAIDDITDIISDLLETKWRIQNNSLADGLWYFQLAFDSHIQQHIVDLLNYIKVKNS